MTIALIVLNIAAFLFEMPDPNRLISLFALWPLSSGFGNEAAFHLRQMVTYSALHANLTRLAFNMFGFYVFGRDVERTIGRVRVAVLYVASQVTACSNSCWVSVGEKPTWRILRI